MEHFDVIIIGSGPAGEKAAAQAAYIGKKVLIIEKEPVVGGAMVNTGTLPSKTLRETSLFFSGKKQRGMYGIEFNFGKQITVQDLMFRKNFIIKKEIEMINENLAKHKVKQVQGTAYFIDEHTIGIDGSAEKFRGDFILIAVGTYPFRPNTIPFEEEQVYDSDEILHMIKIPESMVIIGAGVIGCEYACMFAALGIEITLIEPRDSILPFIDGEISQLLVDEMKLLGVKFIFNDSVEKVEMKNGMCETYLKSGEVLTSETHLWAAGRVGNTAKLKLENIGLAANNRGQLEVNEHYQTKIPHIYAAGDVIGFPSLASTSMEQGRVAMCHAFDFRYKDRMAALLPYGIYTIPEVSMVGMTEEEAKRKNIDYEVGISRYADHPRGQIIGNERGMLKLIFAKADKKLLGVHVIGDNAAEIIHIGMMVMHFEGTIDAFISSVFNYPTLSDIYKYATYDGLGNLSGHKIRK
ncbi:MAG TPA: Si-specific NAD(P)(+) transhydrogenase [Pyrinomonadaceae bacterium]|nr:Si-specific NAD(P)(+) transhydrogenase [Pyrinomonadaceae bacterium]